METRKGIFRDAHKTNPIIIERKSPIIHRKMRILTPLTTGIGGFSSLTRFNQNC